ncbi:MAG: DUF2961 domain-containing protein [Armatimonadetes bacterium]|nr:DUF2961 domain-containing protein [Armatimonadota bacterium]MDW8122662.1 glycoside hydrolase family 172 protein [Armatimonadota bacterium]
MERQKVLACLLIVLVSSSLTFSQIGSDLLITLPLIQKGRTRRASSSALDWAKSNADARPIPPGQTLVLADLKGPGIIRHIWITIASPEKGYPRLLLLRMFWDGEENPSVLCPLGDFFGMGHGLDVPFDSLPVRVTSEGRARNCYWPMPFRKSARIEVVNEGDQPVHAFYYYIDWEEVDQLPDNVAYFHAQYRQEFPAVAGKRYLIADIEGEGHYVGTVLSVRQRTQGWWGEGDDFFFIDGEEEPSLKGTGTEDYFCDAWGFRRQAGPFYGAPLVEGYDPGSRTTVYRWHLLDPIRFVKSLRVEIEHMGFTFNPDGSVRSSFEERDDDFSSVAFWYQKEPHRPFPPIPVGYQRLYYDYRAMIEGEDLVKGAQVTSGDIDPQALGGYSRGAQLFWRPLSEGQALTVTFEVKEKGRYDFLFVLTHSWDYGIYQIELDGVALSRPLDLYHPTVEPREYFFLGRELEAGKHQLTFRNKGRNPASKGFFFGMDGFLLVRR